MTTSPKVARQAGEINNDNNGQLLHETEQTNKKLRRRNTNKIRTKETSEKTRQNFQQTHLTHHNRFLESPFKGKQKP